MPTPTDRTIKLIELAAEMVVDAITEVTQDLIAGEYLDSRFPEVYDSGTAAEIDELENEFQEIVDLAVQEALMAMLTHDPISR